MCVTDLLVLRSLGCRCCSGSLLLFLGLQAEKQSGAMKTWEQVQTHSGSRYCFTTPRIYLKSHHFTLCFRACVRFGLTFPDRSNSSFSSEMHNKTREDCYKNIRTWQVRYSILSIFSFYLLFVCERVYYKFIIQLETLSYTNITSCSERTGWNRTCCS